MFACKFTEIEGHMISSHDTWDPLLQKRTTSCDRWTLCKDALALFIWASDVYCWCFRQLKDFLLLGCTVTTGDVSPWHHAICIGPLICDEYQNYTIRQQNGARNAGNDSQHLFSRVFACSFFFCCCCFNSPGTQRAPKLDSWRAVASRYSSGIARRLLLSLLRLLRLHIYHAAFFFFFTFRPRVDSGDSQRRLSTKQKFKSRNRKLILKHQIQKTN